MRIAVILSLVLCHAGLAATSLFTNQTEIGNPARPGKTDFDEAKSSYLIAGGGENMWFTNDALHFAWTRLSGDFSLSAVVDWVNAGGNLHRKACLMMRESLEPDAAYIDAAVHGDGLISLQFRQMKGGLTREVQARQKGFGRVGLRRHGNTVYLRLPAPAGGLEPAGPFTRIELKDPVYVGLGVCAHDNKALETARFTQASLEREPASGNKETLHSSLETISIKSLDRRLIHHSRNHFEAPNWSPDDKFLLFNSSGRLYRLPRAGGEPQGIDTGFAVKCNNDHGISPDGTRLVISDQTKTGKSLIYVLPIVGGAPELVTLNGPSYWHGWSPDGKWLAYCAERGGEYDVYTIPVQGGQERRLTTAPGLDDGPEYSPDGKYIYFNSERSGRMQIWRMKPDGASQEQVTDDQWNNWFPHPSPDGKWIVCLAYAGDVKGHPANQPVRLRLIPADGGPVKELTTLFGGQGTINVPSWSPDSQNLAFVSYELLPE